MLRAASLKRAKTVVVGVSILVLVFIVIYVSRAAWLPVIGSFLIVKDPPEAADIIYVLNGDPNTRPFEAARLYQEGLAPKVAIARAENSMTNVVNLTMNTTDLCIKVLHAGGITGGHLVELNMPGGVRSTFDEAMLLKEYAVRTGIRRVIVVTSEFHSRRAKWIFQKVLKNERVKIIIRPVANPKYGKDNWWRKEDGLIGCQNEYIKLIFYLMHYRNIADSPQIHPAESRASLQST